MGLQGTSNKWTGWEVFRVLGEMEDMTNGRCRSIFASFVDMMMRERGGKAEVV